ncbi:MAG: HPr family phosphocarrier protein [Oscillospiraceae bacterium]|jgi:phosphocarrier protein|nr:HPr family phosphocarrier protein [Oscillospiraceae bacterium]
MERMEFVIKDPDGIHARPAGVLVKRMQAFPCDILIEKGDKEADGKKLFALMKMAVKKGDTITITARGDQAAEAIAAAALVFEETGL